MNSETEIEEGGGTYHWISQLSSRNEEKGGTCKIYDILTFLPELREKVEDKRYYNFSSTGSVPTEAAGGERGKADSHARGKTGRPINYYVTIM